MTIPVEIVATLMGVGLTAAIISHRSLMKRMGNVEKNILTIMVMLRDHGFRVPDPEDTDIFRRANNL